MTADSNNKEEKKMKTKKKILVVDDDRIIVKLVKEILEREGFKVETTRDGLQGFEKIQQNRYDAIICNMNMPRMKEDELYLEVQKLGQDLSKKIIFISGNINDFIKSTGNRFLVKPFSHQQLIEIVKDTIAPNV